MAGVTGLILVFAFMIIYYRIPGLAASIALVMYTAFVIVLLSAFNEEITLTLPGIVGIILWYWYGCRCKLYYLRTYP